MLLLKILKAVRMSDLVTKMLLRMSLLEQLDWRPGFAPDSHSELCSLGGGRDDDSWGPTKVGDLHGVPGSWSWPGPAAVIGSTCVANRRMANFFLSLSLPLK